MKIKTAFASIALLGCAFSIAACSSSSHKSTGTPLASSTARSQATTTTSAPPTVPQNTQLPTSVANDTSLRTDVTIAACDQTGGGWAASGTVTNSGQSTKTYDITVFFTSAKATVEDYATTSVKVKPGDHQDWKASKDFPALSGTLCVLRGVAAG